LNDVPMISTRPSSVTVERIRLGWIRRFRWLGVTRKQRQREYSRTFFFWKKSSVTRLMLISRIYRFSNWQNALTCLTQEPYAQREDAGNLRSMEIARVNYRITEVSDWESSWVRRFVSRRSLAHGDEEAVKIRFAYPRQFVTQMIPT